MICMEARQTSKLQNRRPSVYDVELYLTVHQSFVSAWLNINYSSWFNHRDRVQININSMTKHNDICLVSKTLYLDRLCFII
jgi:hypothetical protein